MTTQKIIKIVLPTTTEFVRYMAEIILLNQKNVKDTSTTVTPIVTRAKALVDKKGLIIATLEKEKGDG